MYFLNEVCKTNNKRDVRFLGKIFFTTTDLINDTHEVYGQVTDGDASKFWVTLSGGYMKFVVSASSIPKFP